MTARTRAGRAAQPAVDLADRLTALHRAVELADGRLAEPAVAAARALAGKAGDRLRLGPDSTVVALAGATGSGKSSLFNALVGEPVAAVGVRRPTTATTQAGVWPPDGVSPAGPLLDWLTIPRRHHLGTDARRSPAAADGALAGLVLLDLPDFDSTAAPHRVEVDRLVDLVDLLVWVLDPQKYADAALHDRYLRPLAGHADVMLVVLNQADRLDDDARAACLADLRRLLDAEGLGAVPVLAASALTGTGVAELRDRLADRVAARRAAVQRLAADLDRVVEDLSVGCTDPAAPTGGPPGIRPADRAALVEALTDAAGADVVERAVAQSHRARARAATGWPVTRWLGRLRPDPLRRLRLPTTPDELVRTALPGPSPVQRARVDTALRRLGDAATAGLPDPWTALVRRVTVTAPAPGTGPGPDPGPDLADRLDRAVAGTDLGVGRAPRWWRLAGGLQALFAAAAVVGGLWLAGLFALDWLRFAEPPLPYVGPVPLPTLLLAGGLLAGALLAVLSRRLAAVGARRRGRRARRRVAERVEQVAEERVIEPVRQELAARHELCAELARARRR